jgi:hypothetical protein
MADSGKSTPTVIKKYANRRLYHRASRIFTVSHEPTLKPSCAGENSNLRAVHANWPRCQRDFSAMRLS